VVTFTKEKYRLNYRDIINFCPLWLFLPPNETKNKIPLRPGQEK
jgi:hypothetical protein